MDFDFLICFLRFCIGVDFLIEKCIEVLFVKVEGFVCCFIVYICLLLLELLK